MMLRQDGLVEHVAGGPGLVITEQAPAIAPGWQAAARRRGPSRVGPEYVALTVRTAIDLADAHGLADTSIRRIAGELDMDFVTVRKHVHDRHRLEILMADAVFAEHPPPECPAAAGGSSCRRCAAGSC